MFAPMHRQAWRSAAVLICALVLTGCGETHSESWQYGYDHAESAARLTTSGLSNEDACRSIIQRGGDADGLDRNDIVAGCLAALAGG